MKNKVAITSTNPDETYCEKLGSLDRSTRARVPSKAIAKRTLGNQRTKNNPRIPTNLDEYNGNLYT